MSIEEGRAKSFISAAITAFIILLLIFSGPAAAVQVSLAADKSTVQVGSGTENTITFNVTINLSSPDIYVPIQNLSLNLTGTKNRTWYFDLGGTVISGQEFSGEISVTPTGSLGSSAYGSGYGYGYDDGQYYDFGYGYGYGNGSSTYIKSFNVTLNTSRMLDGNYTAKAHAYTGSSTKPYFSSSAYSFIILPPPPVSTVLTPAANTTVNTSVINTSIAATWYSISTNDSIAVNITTNMSATASAFNTTDLSTVSGAIPDIYVNISVNTTQVYSNITIVHLRVYYDESRIPSGVSEDSLRPLRYTNGSWVRLNAPPQTTLADGTILYASGVDTTNNFVWANLSRFSVYGIGGTVIAAAAAPLIPAAVGGVSVTPPDEFTLSIPYLRPGELTHFTISDSKEIYITKISITAKNWIFAEEVKYKTLSAKPTAVVSVPPGEVFKYMGLTPGYLKSGDIAYVEFEFKAAKSWLKDKGLSADEVSLYRYFADRWDKLLTSRVREDADYVYYSARSPGFSYFAIVGEKAVVTPTPAPTTTAPPLTPTPTPQVTPPVTLPATPPATPSATPAPTPPPTPLGGILLGAIIFIAIAAAAYYLLKRKKS